MSMHGILFTPSGDVVDPTGGIVAQMNGETEAQPVQAVAATPQAPQPVAEQASQDLLDTARARADAQALIQKLQAEVERVRKAEEDRKRKRGEEEQKEAAPAAAKAAKTNAGRRSARNANKPKPNYEEVDEDHDMSDDERELSKQKAEQRRVVKPKRSSKPTKPRWSQEQHNRFKLLVRKAMNREKTCDTDKPTPKLTGFEAEELYALNEAAVHHTGVKKIQDNFYTTYATQELLMRFVSTWIATNGKKKKGNRITTLGALELVREAIIASPFRFSYGKHGTGFSTPDKPRRLSRKWCARIDSGEGYKDYSKMHWEIYLDSGYGVFSNGMAMEWPGYLKTAFDLVWGKDCIDFLPGCQTTSDCGNLLYACKWTDEDMPKPVETVKNLSNDEKLALLGKRAIRRNGIKPDESEVDQLNDTSNNIVVNDCWFEEHCAWCGRTREDEDEIHNNEQFLLYKCRYCYYD